MRYDNFTPYQFREMEPYVDTLVGCAHTPVALDVALPHGAAGWIGDALAEAVLEPFAGRAIRLDAGAAVMTASLDSVLQALPCLYGCSLRYGLLVVDRLLLRPVVQKSVSHMQWLIFDWYQWLRSRVEANRLADAVMYMSVARPAYQTSAEFARLGIDSTIAMAMAEEGRRLIDTMASDLTARLRQLWQGADST
ncbi:MAG: hypothetical protein K6T83_14155 [Alicyclobacillus sp.]|nr:hypothetical protein [Alicyclobacillus sp.]